MNAGRCNTYDAGDSAESCESQPERFGKCVFCFGQVCCELAAGRRDPRVINTLLRVQHQSFLTNLFTKMFLLTRPLSKSSEPLHDITFCKTALHPQGMTVFKVVVTNIAGLRQQFRRTRPARLKSCRIKNWSATIGSLNPSRRQRHRRLTGLLFGLSFSLVNSF